MAEGTHKTCDDSELKRAIIGYLECKDVPGGIQIMEGDQIYACADDDGNAWRIKQHVGVNSLECKDIPNGGIRITKPKKEKGNGIGGFIKI